MTQSLDELDWKIVAILRVDGRLSNREIGRRLEVSEGTVRGRLKRLRERRIVRITAVTDVRALGTNVWGYIGLKVERDRLYEVARALEKIPELSFVALTLGLYDILAFVVADSREQLLEILAERIRGIPGVRRTETAEALDVVKHQFALARIPG
ncbi:MAG: Lrp/AsnC family transcriptional regulator [Candidatus Binatia bacterium]